MIVACAMSAAIDIFGLTRYLPGNNITDLYILTGFSAFAIVRHRPKKDELQSLYAHAGPDGMSAP